jgi:hypothetical protein
MEELAYRRIMDLIYVTEDKLMNDDKRLAWMTKTGRQWKRIKESLIAYGKIQIVDARICVARCSVTLQETVRFTSGYPSASLGPRISKPHVSNLSSSVVRSPA